MHRPASKLPLTVIAFSKDRPLQLHAALASLRATCLDLDAVLVRAIVYASTDEMARRYAALARELPWVELVPEDGFAATLLASLEGAGHVLFLVDDTVFVRPWRVDQALAMLAQVPKAIGVSLRLGRNTTSCYTLRQSQPVPPALPLEGGWLACDWTAASHDFAYPLELSSSIYRLRDAWPTLQAQGYRNPNELEVRLSEARHGFATSHPALLFPPISIAFSVPLNVVQQSFDNRHGGRSDRSPEALGTLFDAGVRVDVAALQGHVPDACHQEIELPFLERRAAAPDRPRVSVVVPCWKQAEYLPFVVSSVALQTYQDWELIVVDDGSPDGAADAVRRLAASLPQRRIRLLTQPNSGLANARNAGIQAARGEYILPLDADDALDPSFLERTVAALDGNPAAALAYTDVTVFGARDGVWETARQLDPAHLKAENGLPYCSLYRREVWERIGGYRANMSAGYEDWDFWLAAALQGFQGLHLPEPLLYYREKPASMLVSARQHDGSLRARMRLNNPGAFSPEELAVAAEALRDAPLPPAKAAAPWREVGLGGPASDLPTTPEAAMPAPPPPATPRTAAPPARPPAPSAGAAGGKPSLQEIHDFNQRARDRWVAEMARSVPAGARVLDVGAGTCPYRGLFSHTRYVTHDFKKYEGVKLGGASEYGTIDIVSEIGRIPVEDGSFDVVLCTEVLEHVPDPASAVAEMARILAPGGRVFLTAPLGSGLHQLPFHYYGGFTPAWYQWALSSARLDLVQLLPNGRFFKLLAQEVARAASLLASARPPPPGVTPESLRLLDDLLPTWFYELDDLVPHDQFTVGYFVEGVKPDARA